VTRPDKYPQTRKLGKQVSSDQSLYEMLSDFNVHCRAAVAALQGCKKVIPNQDRKFCRLLIEEARAVASQSFVESLSESETEIASAASKKRIALERRMLK